MRIKLIFGFFILFLSCRNDNSTIVINPSGKMLLERITVPEGYDWIIEENGSLGKFLQHSKLKKAGSPVLNYKQKPIRNQSKHIGIFDYNASDKDLQQCADAVIRLRVEYLFHHKKFNAIKFHFTNGDLFS